MSQFTYTDADALLQAVAEVQSEAERYFEAADSADDYLKEVDRYAFEVLERVREESEWLRKLPSRRETHAYLGKIAGALKIPPRFQEDAIREALNNMYGYGKLQSVIDDPHVSDAQVVGGIGIIITRKGERSMLKSIVMSDEEILEFVGKKFAGTSYKLDLANPRCDAMLADGYRLHVRAGSSGWTVEREFGLRLPKECVIMTIRKPLFNFRLEDLHQLRMFSEEMLEFFRFSQKIAYRYVVGGGTGSAKSTVMAALMGTIPDNEVSCVVEEMPELQPLAKWVARLYNKAPNHEGKGEINMADSIVDTLRMFFDNVFVGETRTEDVAYEYLQAGIVVTRQTGTTTHAAPNAPSMIQRMCLLAAGSSKKPGMETVASIFSSVTNLTIGCARTRFGKRITEIAEILPYDVERKAVPYVVVAEWNGETDAFVFHGITERMAQKARLEGIEPPQTLPMQHHPEVHYVPIGSRG
ncbi:MAG: ATPase, T2SS/T4P/T4SS family [Alicyclobacillaceae bacterium]|nr:ATPase, T2SS/T4P/T4SS family [Alicyclobacillaceae bacterium]